MAEDMYMVAIVLLLPLTAGMLVTQTNPYHGLVIRGILGAVAALVYALFGAADVALTEALVGTMLSITLYAVAVRSSLSMRLGVLAPDASSHSGPTVESEAWEPLLATLRTCLGRHHMRLELVPYPNLQALQSALKTKEVHTICRVPVLESPWDSTAAPYDLETRVHRLYELLQAELSPSLARLSHVAPASVGHSHSRTTGVGEVNSPEVQP
ncbi:Na(+)/H(+) antiporter subunit B [Halomicronema hongdechloris C2206]|uniref:Na(+)/H(+) antiporter subunit B n=1 Tax=Halomicronema hongdechloris C2206 TaxID=1641165 RepID=A0A1V8NKU6_9CYAN|nr:DUF4040 domain-containing protein [Halomicronema hongdechloris]ASC69886.1 Na(+)/H(+) antiporter subunit B [Halomicronema hongdechloris C2206]